MDKSYILANIEPKWFAKWQSSGAFSRNSAADKTNPSQNYTITIPPPNVTGQLHLGHALNSTIQDILIRRARMQGKATRWVLGTDHAGIATQNKVEQKLEQSGKTRFDVGRDEFVKLCWEWKNEYGSTIVSQLKQMGCSLDYEAENFTMDPSYASAVRQVFVDWYKAGLIYRGNRIINWCPRCTTALADDEVEHKDELGHLWHLKYPLTSAIDGITHLTVATTRPETMLGDVAVAVHPQDKRYQALIKNSATIELPLVNRTIPIIADDMVDIEFGTGAVKITPAHDPNDFGTGQRHKLEQINVFDQHAVVVAGYGEYSGLSRDEARKAVVRSFEQLGLLEQTEEHEHSVGHCYRCDTTIEPWLSLQWFVAMRQLAEPAIEVVKADKVKFHAKRWEKTYFDWLENVRDWCISRQLWWGHRIPMFYCDSCGWEDASLDDITICPECGQAARQDEDVLDTWFSSQLWPFVTLGWGENNVNDTNATMSLRGGGGGACPTHSRRAAIHNGTEYPAYYPTQVLSTARDIIFLWVARMVMSSLYFTKQIPFSDVVIHPTVLDPQGRRMSKSLGNGVDPLDLIGELGADAMRFGLALNISSAQDIKYDHQKLIAARNFANKLYNAGNFVFGKISLTPKDLPDVSTFDFNAEQYLPERAILSKLAAYMAEYELYLNEYKIGEAASATYRFVWNEFCDYYIEIAKIADESKQPITQAVLLYVFDRVLHYLHPFMPHLTEELYSNLPKAKQAEALLITSPWPSSDELEHFRNSDSEQAIELLQSIVSATRALRNRAGIGNKVCINVCINNISDNKQNGLPRLKQVQARNDIELISQWGKFESLNFDTPPPPNSISELVGNLEVSIDVSSTIDTEAEKARLDKKIADAQAKIDQLNVRLVNPDFIARAKPEAVDKVKVEHAELTAQLAADQARLKTL